MGKGSGGTRTSSPASPMGLASGASFGLPESNTNRDFSENRRVYNSYDEGVWQKTLFNEETGGYVVTELTRIPADNVHQNVKDVFKKEQEMCSDLAGFGLGVKHLYEAPGVGSADIEIRHGQHSVVEINGKTADLKELNGSNNIRKEAKDTFDKKKKSDLIVFKFKTRDGKIPNEISKLKAKGWHGIYYYEGGKEKYDF